jgi:RNA polymerase sigma factor (sigma-70 family)
VGVDEQQGHEQRFRALYGAHYAAVTGYARRRVPVPSDAQDVVSETFTIAWRRLPEVPDGEAALPWLYGVARRVLANQRRGNQRRADLSVRVRGQERRLLLAALSRLRESDQELLRLAVWEELPHREIAGVVGCSESSVAVRLHRARTRLGREIGKEERRVGQEESARRMEGHRDD